MEAQCVLCEAQIESLYVVQRFSLYSWLVALFLALLFQPPPHALPLGPLHALPGSSATDQFSSILPRCGHKPQRGLIPTLLHVHFLSQDKIADYKGQCTCVSRAHTRVHTHPPTHTHIFVYAHTSHKIAGLVCPVTNYNCSKYRQIPLAQ